MNETGESLPLWVYILVKEIPRIHTDFLKTKLYDILE